MEDLLAKLYELLREETKNPELGRIPKSIYKDAARHIRTFRKTTNQGRKDVVGRIAVKERELIVTLVQRLLESRVRKVFEAEGELNTENLTSEEKYVLDPLGLFKKRTVRIVSAVRDGQTSVLESVSQIVASRYMVVRFLQALPSMMGTDLVKYGPFKAEDVTVLPVENAKPLMKQGVVQEIWVED